jgi:hypothetical protein
MRSLFSGRNETLEPLSVLTHIHRPIRFIFLCHEDTVTHFFSCLKQSFKVVYEDKSVQELSFHYVLLLHIHLEYCTVHAISQGLDGKSNK